MRIRATPLPSSLHWRISKISSSARTMRVADGAKPSGGVLRPNCGPREAAFMRIWATPLPTPPLTGGYQRFPLSRGRNVPARQIAAAVSLYGTADLFRTRRAIASGTNPSSASSATLKPACRQGGAGKVFVVFPDGINALQGLQGIAASRPPGSRRSARHIYAPPALSAQKFAASSGRSQAHAYPRQTAPSSAAFAGCSSP